MKNLKIQLFLLNIINSITHELDKFKKDINSLMIYKQYLSTSLFINFEYNNNKN